MGNYVTNAAEERQIEKQKERQIERLIERRFKRQIQQSWQNIDEERQIKRLIERRFKRLNKYACKNIYEEKQMERQIKRRFKRPNKYACKNDDDLIKSFRDQKPIKAELLGSGSFKNAYNVKNDPSKVIAQVKTDNSFIKDKIKQVYSEICQHQKTNQTPNIIEVHDANLSQNQMLIQKLVPVQNMKLDNIQKMYAVRDTLKGLNQLHECGYVAHCDLKKQNIGYDEKSKNFKILDLDSAIKSQPKKQQYKAHLFNGYYDSEIQSGTPCTPEKLQNEDKKVIGLSFCQKQVSQGNSSQDPKNPTYYRKHLNKINQDVLKNDKIQTIQSIKKVESIIVEAHKEKIQSLKTELKEQCKQELKSNVISSCLNFIKASYNAYKTRNENIKTQIMKQALKSGINIIGDLQKKKLIQNVIENSTRPSTEILRNFENFSLAPNMNISALKNIGIMFGVKFGHSAINLMTRNQENVEKTEIYLQIRKCAVFTLMQFYVSQIIKSLFMKMKNLKLLIQDKAFFRKFLSLPMGTAKSQSNQVWSVAKLSLINSALMIIVNCGFEIFKSTLFQKLSLKDSIIKNVKSFLSFSSVGSIVGSVIGSVVGSIIPAVGVKTGSLFGQFFGSQLFDWCSKKRFFIPDKTMGQLKQMSIKLKDKIKKLIIY